MAKAIITVENNSSGFSIMVKTSEQALVYPEVLITRNHKSQETTFQVFTSVDESITDTIYSNIYKEVENQGKARDFLQMAYLVYRQKTAQYQSEIEQLVDEILSM
jgi:hypothetical protein